jgi:hypothetical protein
MDLRAPTSDVHEAATGFSPHGGVMKPTTDNLRRLALLLVLCFGWPGLQAGTPAAALDHVVLRRGDKQIQVDGRLLVTAQDGGLLVLARDGVLWAVPPEEQVRHTSDEVPFRPLSRQEMSRRLLAELPRGFDVHQTANYLICYNTSRAYAQWCGLLFERLYRAFSYIEFSKSELGDAAPSIIGYFSLRTNWMTMYDLTGMEALNRFGSRRATSAEINRILARPEALRTVSTIIHEATHQIAFNCGLHTRYSDCPVWFSEGIAMYFETPDLRSTKGWSGIGGINPPRLARFQEYLKRRSPDSLQTLIADDKRFRDPSRNLDAYAEAWSLSYFLIRRYPKQYVAYLKMLSEKRPLLEDGPKIRLKEFEGAFGDLKPLDAEFLRYMRGVR